MGHKGVPLGIEGVEVGPGHPAGQTRIGEIEAGPLHRKDAHPPLPCGPPPVLNQSDPRLATQHIKKLLVDLGMPLAWSFRFFERHG
jgi:hypothetical protein